MISEEEPPDQPVREVDSFSMSGYEFGAALIAGGQSRRMGSDKALLPVRWKGEEIPLWKRQWEVLKELEPKQLIFSGPHRQGVPVVAIPDRWTGCGPLGGVATCLGHCAAEFLLVLAVDLPAMESSFLKRLLLHSESGQGAVPAREGFFEPLAAVYPKRAVDVAIARLGRSELKLQDFVHELVSLGFVRPLPVLPEMNYLFTNWNSR